MIGRVVLLVAIAWGFYTLGRNWGGEEIAAINLKVREIELQRDNFKKTSDLQKAEIEDLRLKLKKSETDLGEFFHPSRAIELTTGESKFISVDQLTIALNGTPRNDGVDLNINGKQQTKVAGDSIAISTTCRLVITKIDILKPAVVINSTCAPAQQP